MPIEIVESTRLYRKIAEQLSALIASGELPEGGRLPSERDLAVQLGVSRPSVREALIALEVAGKVEVRVGAGIFVSTRRPVAVPDPLTEGQGPFELIRARWLFEGEVASEAASSATPEDLRLVRLAITQMQQRQRKRLGEDEADRDFHVGVARATHNSAVVGVVVDLWDRGRGAIWKRMEHHFQTPELRASTLRDHSAVLAALEARDPAGARGAMHAHLERVDREFSRGWELLKERQESAESARAKTASAQPSNRRSRAR